MGALRERMARHREALRLALAVLAGFVLLGAGLRLVYEPLARARAELLQRLEVQRQEVAEARRVYQERDQLHRRLEELEARLAEVQRGLDAGRRQPTFLRYLEDAAHASGAAVTELQFGDPEAVGDTGYRRYPVTVKLVGPYPGLVALVGRLEGATPFVAVDALEAGATEPPGLPQGWVVATVSLSVLGQADGETAWDRELAQWSLGPGRSNPFAPPGGE